MQKTNLWLPGDKWGEGINWEIGIDMYTVRCIKCMTNKKINK